MRFRGKSKPSNPFVPNWRNSKPFSNEPTSLLPRSRKLWRLNMAITVQIPTALRRHTGGTARVTCSPANLGELLAVLDKQFPELKPHLRDEAGQVRRFLNIYVNEEDIRFLGGNGYTFQDGDEVLLVPSVAGGKI